MKFNELSIRNFKIGTVILLLLTLSINNSVASPIYHFHGNRSHLHAFPIQGLNHSHGNGESGAIRNKKRIVNNMTTGNGSPIVSQTNGNVTINYSEKYNIDTWLMAQKKFRELIHLRKYREARDFGGKLLTLAIKDYGSNSLQQRKSIGYIASAEIYLGNYNKGIQLLEMVIDTNSITFSGQESMIVELDNTLTMVGAYNGKKKTDKSHFYLNHAYRLKKIIGEAVRPHEMVSLAMVEGVKATVLITEGKYKEGIQAASLAMEMLDKVPNGNDGTLYGVYEIHSLQSAIQMAKYAMEQTQKK